MAETMQADMNWFGVLAHHATRTPDQAITVFRGETTSYAALAEAIGHPGSARAVGAANGANPLAIVVPCHRVVGADGTLTGYAGGLDAKRSLLTLEEPVPAA